jgi:hypothetical protein
MRRRGIPHLLPSVESATLRAHILDVRGKVQAHLTRAVALRATLP